MTQFGSVLIVEDDPALAGALGETLRLAEYPYVTVASAEAAIVCHVSLQPPGVLCVWRVAAGVMPHGKGDIRFIVVLVADRERESARGFLGPGQRPRDAADVGPGGHQHFIVFFFLPMVPRFRTFSM